MLLRGLAVLALAGFVLGGLAMNPATSARADSAAKAGEFVIDTHYSSMTFRVRHMGVGQFWGRINKPTGTFLIEEGTGHVDITIEMKNMDTGNKNRDLFAIGPDFFNARKNPASTFKSNSIKKIDDDTYEATGQLTMRGVTKEITATLDYYAQRQTAKLGYRGGFECTFTISRREFGMTKFFEDEALGDEVQIIAAIQGVRK